MSRLFRSALSMESKQPEEVQINPLEAELALESATLEVTEAGHSVQMAELTQEELEHAHISLESIAMSLESLMAADERGLDRVSAEGYQHAVSAILGDALPNPVTSLESFGGESECAEATQLSLEGIKETLQKFWEGIKRSIANAIRSVSDFFAKLFGGVKKLQDRIASMKTEAADLKKKGAKASGKFKVPGADALHVGGKLDARTLEQGMKAMSDEALGYGNALQEAAEDYYKSLADFYSSADEGKLTGAHKKAMDQISKAKFKGADLPGGKTFELETESKGDFTTVGIPKLVDSSAKAPSGDVEIDVLDLGTIEKLLDQAAKFADEMSKLKDRREKLKAARENVMKSADKFVSDSEKLSEKASEKWTQAKLNWALRSANRDFASTIARVDGYTFKYVRALLAALNAALGKYSEASTEDRDEDADDEAADQTTNGDDDAADDETASTEDGEGGEGEGEKKDNEEGDEK